jgi:hypothetical protein
MALKDSLARSMQRIITKGGTQIRVRYFSQTLGSVYDDDTTLAVSGNDLWTSGVFLPLSKQLGGPDRILVEQGKLSQEDSKLFTHGSLLFTSGVTQVKINIGSPLNADREFTMIPLGPTIASVSEVPIYRTVYLRKVGGTGSLLGEN